MKKILVVKDMENEAGFHILCEYCEVVQERLGSDVVVLPIWPNGRIDLIDDEKEVKLVVKSLKKLIKELEVNLDD